MMWVLRPCLEIVLPDTYAVSAKGPRFGGNDSTDRVGIAKKGDWNAPERNPKSE